ncbi:MAG: DUF4097 domain-containing protein [Gammaproteobacteria bacterium]|nr:DUF4097 domain-containing protein [Gammaproteobacteria bacterium]
MVPVFVAAFLSVIGTGGDSDGLNLVTCAPDEVSNRNFSAQEPFSFNINVVNHVDLLMNAKDGDITISGIPGSASITIIGTRRVQSESVADAQAHLAKLQVSVQDLTTRARVETSQPQCPLGRGYFVDYTVTLPSFFALILNNNGGDVTLDALGGKVSMNNIAGTITLTDISGNAEINLLSGNIVAGIASLPLNGRIDMTVLSGNIDLEIPVNTSAEFFARVFSGSINVSNLALDNEIITATTVSGTLGGGQGEIQLETQVVGDIDVTGI